MTHSILYDLRRKYHQNICEKILGEFCSENGIHSYNNADISNPISRELAAGIAAKIDLPMCNRRISGQTSGTLFATHTKDFIEQAFKLLHALRPGKWRFSTSQGSTGIGAFEQYDHLSHLQQVLQEHPELKATLGGDYVITPDIIVARRPVDDDEINADAQLVGCSDKPVAIYTPLRAANSEQPREILHASISCKWTMRSDRAQNTRTEALNLIRHRKGATPHIVAVTFEPLPNRLASIAMGTGDIDCTYHGALYELMESAKDIGNDAVTEMLDTLVEGRRLRDISDLPFDLAT